MLSNKHMDIAEIRRRNLRLLIDQQFAGVAAELARLLGKQPSELSRIFSSIPAHRRNIGSRLARTIEQAVGKENGWMDRVQTGTTPPDRQHAAAAQRNIGPGPELRTRVPIISWVQAGEGVSSGPGCPVGEADEWVSATAPVGAHAYALRIVGDSMEPKFPEGGIIIVDPEVQARPGAFVVACLHDTGETTFKQLIVDGKRLLKPLNSRYPIMEMRSGDVICGVVKQLVMVVNFD